MSDTETSEEMLQAGMMKLWHEYHRSVMSRNIKLGIRHRRELQAKQLKND